MSSEIKADKWSPASGTSATIGDSGDTFTIPSGVTLDTSSSTLTLPSSAITGQTAITSLADTDKFLVSDASDSGNLKYVEKQYLPSGTWVRLGGTDATGLSDITYDLFSATYKVYKIIGTHSMGVNSTELRFRMRKSGSDQTGSNYRYIVNLAQRTSSSGSTTNFSGWNDDHGRFTHGSSYSAAHPTSMEINVYAPFDSTRQTSLIYLTTYYKPSEDSWNRASGGAWIDGSSGTDNTGIKIYGASGTIDNADYSIYGLKES
tara:strand:+ start:244 stop:1026 length:783 start_codon:yes stop_codon:yes gene_type:complete